MTVEHLQISNWSGACIIPVHYFADHIGGRSSDLAHQLRIQRADACGGRGARLADRSAHLHNGRDG